MTWFCPIVRRRHGPRRRLGAVTHVIDDLLEGGGGRGGGSEGAEAFNAGPETTAERRRLPVRFSGAEGRQIVAGRKLGGGHVRGPSERGGKGGRDKKGGCCYCCCC